MSLKPHTKSIVAGALIIALVFSYVPFSGLHIVNSAFAEDAGDAIAIPIQNNAIEVQETVHTGDSLWGIPIPFSSLDSVLKFAVKLFIEQLQKEVINWINRGTDGNPIYEINLGNFLVDVHDKIGTKSIDTLSTDSGPVCGYYKSDVISGLSTFFNTPGTKDATVKGNCIAEKTVGETKVNTFVNGNFQSGGGWDTWTLVTQNDDSNPLGSYLSQQDTIAGNISNQQNIEQQKLAWGNGFHSQEDTNGNVKTPGTVIREQANSVLTSDLRQLEQAKTWDDAVTVLAESLISNLINSKDGLRGNNSNKSTNTSSGKYLKAKNPKRSSSKGTKTTTGAPESGSSALQNVAITGTASQSSTLGSHDASVALTGSKNRDPALGGLSMTEPQTNPWWQVDLGSEQPIDHIEITPRINDSFGNDLKDFVVVINENPMTDNFLPASGPGVWKSDVLPAFPRSSASIITPPAGTIGRYVRIQEINANTRLEIAGVQIFAKAVPVVTLIGDNPLTIAHGATFEDPGAVAIDKNDGDITEKIVVTGASSVNTAIPGTYTISYQVTNSAGVSSGLLNRQVIVQ